MADSQERTWKEQAEALIAKWRAEEADYKQNAANHAPLGGSLYVSNQSKWALSQRHADELSALLASPCQQGQGWQPMETAPKDDGRDVIIADADGLVGHGFFDRSNQVWRWLDDDPIDRPTHWQPMPLPPVSDPLPAGEQ